MAGTAPADGCAALVRRDLCAFTVYFARRRGDFREKTADCAALHGADSGAPDSCRDALPAGSGGGSGVFGAGFALGKRVGRAGSADFLHGFSVSDKKGLDKTEKM